MIIFVIHAKRLYGCVYIEISVPLFSRVLAYGITCYIRNLGPFFFFFFNVAHLKNLRHIT